MADSPQSDSFSSRMSTPVNELDDHRNQSASLPRADVSAPQRRRSIAGQHPASELLSVPLVAPEGVISRDFENAIIDEETSETASQGVNNDRAESSSPVVGRKNTTSRARQQQEEKLAKPRLSNELKKSKSSPSSSSARSSSPPNSVDAFASPRMRARAGTATSIAPSYLTLDRPNSAHSTNRGRTFSDEQTVKFQGKPSLPLEQSSEGSVEDDVCFPPPDEGDQPETIDFDELHEFVSQNKERGHVPNPFDRKPSIVPPYRRPPHVDDFDREKPSHQISRLFKHSSRSARKAPDTQLSHHHSFPQGFKDAQKAARSYSEADAEGVDSDLDEKRDLSSTEERPGPRLDPTNRWTFFSSSLAETIFAPDLGDLLMPGETFRSLFDLGTEGGCWWLDVLMPSEEEIEVICKAFGIHGLTREDIIQQESREKVELFKSYYFLCFRSFYQQDPTSEWYMEPINVYAVVFREGILTFTFAPAPHASNVRKRMGKLRDYVSVGSDWICYALIDDIVDSYEPAIREVEQEADTIEDTVFTARPEDSKQLLRQIGECRKTIMSLTRLVGGKADVIKGFAKRCNESYSIAPRQDVGMYLSDIQDHVVTMSSNLNHFEKMLSRSHSNYLAQMSVDQIEQGTKANAVLSKVTVIATILVPMNLVCGLFGMNVNVPGKDDGGYYWFGGIIGTITLFCGVCLLIVRRMRLT